MTPKVEELARLAKKLAWKTSDEKVTERAIALAVRAYEAAVDKQFYPASASMVNWREACRAAAMKELEGK